MQQPVALGEVGAVPRMLFRFCKANGRGKPRPYHALRMA